MQRLSFVFGLAVLSSTAHAYDIGAYAVSKHKSCGASNLPGTTAEMKKFFGSSDFPKDARKNFLWIDAEVHQDEWAAAGDHRASAATANKFNGVDASEISYIASHGVTSQGVYTALMGTSRFGGCSAKSKDMLLGDSKTRYLILSTCQGLKIGSGDGPTRPGENPSNTWAKSAAGLQCVLGYSNNMADTDSYGANFLKIMATQAETISGAFFKASRAASYANIPAMLCFGDSVEDAKAKITSDKSWRSEASSNAASAWVYERSRQIVAAQTYSNDAAPSRLAIHDREFPTAAMNKLQGRAAKLFRSEGSIIRFSQDLKPAAFVQGELSDEQAIRIATAFISQNNLALTTDVLQPTYIIDAVAGDAGGAKKPFRKTVVFHQNVHQLTPLQQNGSIEIAVEASQEVSAFTWALRDFAPAALTKKVGSHAQVVETAKAAALRAWTRQHPGAKIVWESTHLGYDAGSWNSTKDSADLVAQSWASISEGGYTRRYVHTYQP